jgi:transposase
MVDQNYSIVQVCAASGSGSSAARRWKHRYLAELAGQTLPHIWAITPEKREIVPLKQRIRDFELDKEILKKASALFAREL